MTKRRQHEKSRKHSTHECMPGSESHSGNHLFNKHGRREESLVQEAAKAQRRVYKKLQQNAEHALEKERSPTYIWEDTAAALKNIERDSHKPLGNKKEAEQVYNGVWTSMRSHFRRTSKKNGS